VDDEGRVSAVWRRQGSVFATDGNGAEKPLGSGRSPTTVVTKNGVYSAWTAEGAVMLRKPSADQPNIVGDGAFPSMAALADGSVVLVWESKGAVVVERVE
jgi:hypothetical protein